MKARRVFASGTFDLFHLGHLQFLERAKRMGEELIVGVQTDERVVQTRGRAPVYPLWHRLRLVSALACVDIAVPVNGPDDELDVVTNNAEIWAVGPEFAQLPGHESLPEKLQAMGIRCVLISRTPDISTTSIKRRIRNGKEES